MDSKLQSPILDWGRRSERKWATAVVLGLVWLAGVLSASHLKVGLDLFSSKPPSGELQSDYKCRPPLPALFAYAPPPEDHPELVAAGQALHTFLSKRTSRSDIDSLVLAIVTPYGPIFERGYGVLKANITDPTKRDSVDRDTIYRLASVSKMFTALETLILRERGVLSWDDPVTKFFPQFTYPSYGWAEYLSEETEQGTSTSPTIAPMTLRQLASHMSGLGREVPPIDLGTHWPQMPPVINFTLPTFEGILKAIATFPLVAAPYTYPVYSNIGYSLLGLCNVVANQFVNGVAGQPATHAELLERDVFKPLGMNSSFFRFPKGSDLAERVAVPSKDSEWTEGADSDDVQDPAGGQYSSLADLVRLMQSLLSSRTKKGLLSQYVVREWLKPLYAWSDGLQEVGATWEIAKISGETRLYAKGGNIPGYHALFGIVPDFSYGIVAMMTGEYDDTMALVSEAISHFQPAFERILGTNVAEAYSGSWVDERDSAASIAVTNGSLELTKFIIRGVDIVAAVQAGLKGKVTLWSTGRIGEFRIAIGRPGLNAGERAGCKPYWISIDPANARGAPVDLLYFKDGKLEYPSADVRLRKKQRAPSFDIN